MIATFGSVVVELTGMGATYTGAIEFVELNVLVVPVVEPVPKVLVVPVVPVVPEVVVLDVVVADNTLCFQSAK